MQRVMEGAARGHVPIVHTPIRAEDLIVRSVDYHYRDRTSTEELSMHVVIDEWVIRRNEDGEEDQTIPARRFDASVRTFNVGFQPSHSSFVYILLPFDWLEGIPSLTIDRMLEDI